MARYQKTANYPMGSVSHGTMREEDLIPDFCWELKNLAKQTGILPAKARKAHLKMAREIEARIENETEFADEDLGVGGESEWDLDALFDALGEYAAPYFYFGAHPGDGSDYGFWLSDNFQDDFDGPQVSDSLEVPASYRGEYLVVNDHGNMTLMVKSSRKERVIWAVV